MGVTPVGEEREGSPEEPQRAAEHGRDPVRRLELARRWIAAGDKASAIACLDRAWPQLLDPADYARRAAILERLGHLFKVTGQVERSAEYLECALRLRRWRGDRTRDGAILDRLAALYAGLGERRRALDLNREAAEAHGRDGRRHKAAQADFRTAELLAAMGDPEEAAALLERALAEHQGLGRRAWEARARARLGRCAARLGDVPRGIRELKASLELRQAIGDRRGELAVLRRLAELHAVREEHQLARACHERALVLVEAAGDRVAVGHVKAMLAETKRRCGEAHAHWVELLDAADALREGGDLHGAAQLEQAAGERCLALGLTALAGWWFRGAGRCFEKAGDTLGAARAAARYAHARLELGDEAIADLLKEALPVLLRAAPRTWAVEALTDFGRALALQGSHARALDFLGDAVTIAQLNSNGRGEGWALATAGGVRADLGQHAVARGLMGLAVDRLRPAEDRPWDERALRRLAEALARSGDAAGSAQCASRAERLRIPATLQAARTQAQLDIVEAARPVVAYWRRRREPLDDGDLRALLFTALRLVRTWSGANARRPRHLVEWCLRQARQALRERTAPHMADSALRLLAAAAGAHRARPAAELAERNLDLLRAAGGRAVPAEDARRYRRRALSSLAHLSDWAGRPEASIGWLGRALDLGGPGAAPPDDFDLLVRLGDLQHHLGLRTEAARTLDEAVRLSTGSLAQESARQARSARRRQDVPEASGYSEMMRCLALTLRAQLRLADGAVEPAATDLRDAVPWVPTDDADDFELRLRATWLEASARIAHRRGDRAWRARLGEALAIRWRVARGWPGNVRYRRDVARTTALAAELGLDFDDGLGLAGAAPGP